MKKENIRTIILFIILILLIGLLFVYHDYKNRDKKDVDRKVELFYNKYSYDDVYKQANLLFFNTIKILNNDNFDYEKDSNNDVIYYAIDGYTRYKKIMNFNVVTNTLKNTEVSKFMELKKIIEKDNEYYIEEYDEELNLNYIGSIIDIKDHDDNYVYLESLNYYCENTNFMGYLTEKPNCKYQEEKTTFKMELENDNFRISNIDDIKKIY